MKLLHLINDSCVERGGAQRILLKLNEVEHGLMGLDICVFSRSWVSDQKNTSQKKGGLLWPVKLVFLLCRYKPSIIIVHSRMYLPFVLFFNIVGCCTVFYCHAQHRKNTFLFSFFRCKYYVAVSESVRKYLESYSPAERIFLNYNPVCCELSRNGFPSNETTFNYVGALQSWKGIVFFLSFVSRFSEENKMTVKVNIVGDGPEREVIERKKFSDYLDLCFFGYKPNPYDYLNLSNPQVICSLEEGFGMVAVEAQQNGSPILYTKIPALNEVLHDDELAFSYDYNDYESFCKAMTSMLELKRSFPSVEVIDARKKNSRDRYSEGLFRDRYLMILKNIGASRDDNLIL